MHMSTIVHFYMWDVLVHDVNIGFHVDGDVNVNFDAALVDVHIEGHLVYVHAPPDGCGG